MKSKKKREWQPHKDVQVGDITDMGKVVWVEKEFREKPVKEKEFKPRKSIASRYNQSKMGSLPGNVVFPVDGHRASHRSTSSGTVVGMDREHGGWSQHCASAITHNYTRMKRQIESLKSSPEMAPSRKSAERDLCNFLKITREEFRAIRDFSEIIEKLEKWEKSVVVEKAASRFGV